MWCFVNQLPRRNVWVISAKIERTDDQHRVAEHSRIPRRWHVIKFSTLVSSVRRGLGIVANWCYVIPPLLTKHIDAGFFLNRSFTCHVTAPLHVAPSGKFVGHPGNLKIPRRLTRTERTLLSTVALDGSISVSTVPSSHLRQRRSSI